MELGPTRSYRAKHLKSWWGPGAGPAAPAAMAHPIEGKTLPCNFWTIGRKLLLKDIVQLLHDNGVRNKFQPFWSTGLGVMYEAASASICKDCMALTQRFCSSWRCAQHVEPPCHRKRIGKETDNPQIMFMLGWHCGLLAYKRALVEGFCPRACSSSCSQKGCQSCSKYLPKICGICSYNVDCSPSFLRSQVNDAVVKW